MEKFIPFEKLSKKEQRKINNARRNTWGPLNPVTRKTKNGKAYDRKKTQDWKHDASDLRSFYFLKNRGVNFAPCQSPETHV